MDERAKFDRPFHGLQVLPSLTPVNDVVYDTKCPAHDSIERTGPSSKQTGEIVISKAQTTENATRYVQALEAVRQLSDELRRGAQASLEMHAQGGFTPQFMHGLAADLERTSAQCLALSAIAAEGLSQAA